MLIGDVAAVARVLLALPPQVRALRAARLVHAAALADAFRRRTGRPHPVWGAGSLMAAAGRMPKAPASAFDDDGYCDCWQIALAALVRHRVRRRRQPEAQEMQSGVVGSRSSRFSEISSPQSRHSP